MYTITLDYYVKSANAEKIVLKHIQNKKRKDMTILTNLMWNLIAAKIQIFKINTLCICEVCKVEKQKSLIQ